MSKGIAAWLAVAAMTTTLGLPPAVDAETKNKIETKDGKYKQEYEDDQGVKTKYEADAEKIKQEYEDKGCKQKYEKDLESGEVKVESEGDCER
ncbi:MAG TPA: hypothetical protein VEC57_11985 [Candidatus Limnocylindrales bacterium]|nr:hypothetical protein [Candidatus Limnocylindrales bacterium]